MTRPLVRPTTRRRCNLVRDLHRADCPGHLTRAEAQSARRAREKTARRSMAHKRPVRPFMGEVAHSLTEVEIEAVVSTDKPPLRPPARVATVACTWCPEIFPSHRRLAEHNRAMGYATH
jgi:hypothetical protein